MPLHGNPHAHALLSPSPMCNTLLCLCRAHKEAVLCYTKEKETTNSVALPLSSLNHKEPSLVSTVYSGLQPSSSLQLLLFLSPSTSTMSLSHTLSLSAIADPSFFSLQSALSISLQGSCNSLYQSVHWDPSFSLCRPAHWTEDIPLSIAWKAAILKLYLLASSFPYAC